MIFSNRRCNNLPSSDVEPAKDIVKTLVKGSSAPKKRMIPLVKRIEADISPLAW